LSCICIGKFRLSHNIHRIDGQFADGRSKQASGPNRGSPPSPKGKRDASCLNTFKMISREEQRLCSSTTLCLRAQLIREIEKVFRDKIVLTPLRNGRGFAGTMLQRTVDKSRSETVFLS
jgi:hypothetical protein